MNQIDKKTRPQKIIKEDVIIIGDRTYQRCSRIKRDGVQCRNRAEPGYKVCRYHGANIYDRSRQTGFQAMPSKLSETEIEQYNEFLEKLQKDFDLNKSSDQVVAKNASYYYVRLNRVIDDGAPPEVIEKWDKLFRSNLETLKVTRDTREESEKRGNSPAEWACQILEKARKREEEAKSNKEDLN